MFEVVVEVCGGKRLHHLLRPFFTQCVGYFVARKQGAQGYEKEEKITSAHIKNI